MAKNAHLKFDERLSIEASLKEGLIFREIADLIGKDPSTISKEIRGHYKIVEMASYNPCANRSTCAHMGDICSPCHQMWTKTCKKCEDKCFRHCPDFKQVICTRLSKPPYVCNGCDRKNHCTLQRHVYDAKYAQKEYEAVRSESRQGIGISPEELKRIDDVVSPLIKQGHSIHQICANNSDIIMLDEKTIYNYIEAGILTARNIDLPRKVRYKPRKKKKAVRVDKKCHLGRTYDDFKDFMSANPDTPVVEMDSVEGRKGGKVLLTVFFRDSTLMLAYIRESNTARSVREAVNVIYGILGHEKFCELFPVILCDRGSEFTDPLGIEFAPDGRRRTRVFYCDPQRPDQKGCCEVCHEMIRRVIPKKTSFDGFTQTDISIMMSHINSYTRKKLNDRSPHQLFSFLHGEEALSKLGIRLIPSNDINLTQRLLKK